MTALLATSRFLANIGIVLSVLSLTCVDLKAERLTEKKLSIEEGFSWNEQILECTAQKEPENATWFKKGLRKDFDLKEYSGKLACFSAEVRWLGNNAEGRKKGLIQIALADKAGKTDYSSIEIDPAQKEWTPVRKCVTVPENPSMVRIFIGFEKSCGAFEVRNMEFEVIGEPLPLARYANRAIRDTTASDGVGGWTDQGPEADGRVFESFFRENMIGGVPFNIPLQDIDKQILVMRSSRNPSGILEQEIPVAPYEAKYLYVIHALSYAGSNGSAAGRIVIKGTSKKQEIPVVVGRDVGDWWEGKPVSDASDFVRARGPRSEHVLYITKYPLDVNIGIISSVDFISDNEDNVWIICGATLTQKDYKLYSAPKKQPLTIVADEEWQPAIRTVNHHWRAPNSPLDVSKYWSRKPIGPDDRVVINGNGHFVYANEPDKAIRFLCSADTMRFPLPRYPNSRYLYSRGEIDEYVSDLVIHGYNMVRINVNRALIYGSSSEAEFNAVALDNLDWLVSLCRKNGIYMMMNMMDSQYGFYPPEYNQWGNSVDFDGSKNFDVLFALYFSEKARDDWKKGVNKLLTRVNPYTNVALKDDPAFLLPLGFNEQEYAFHFRMITTSNQELAVKPYRDFLKKRYGGIEKYNEKYKTSFKSFDEIPCFTVKDKNDDVNDFLYDVSCELVTWYKTTLQKIGYKGYFSNYDFVKSLTYHFIRQNCDYVAMHVYHDHPLGNTSGKGGYNKQLSSIGKSNFFARSLFGTRIYKKPLVCSEYDIPFWNQYRYENSFVMGAYAAFQGIDALTLWNEPTRRDDLSANTKWFSGRMEPFSGSHDPLSDASQLLTFFMYVRGDVATTAKYIRIVADKESVFKQNPNDAPALEQTALSLLTGYYQESVPTPDKITPPAENEIILSSLGGGKTRIEGFFTETLGTTGNIGNYLKILKEKGFLTPDNRSNGEFIYENSTKELYMDAEKKFMTVNTPRLQGMCGLAGATCKLKDFEVLSHNKNGNLTLVSINGMKPIYDAERLLLVRLTNALNSNMKFEDKDMCKLESVGEIPALLQNSKFTVNIHNKQATSLKLRPLSLEGLRTGKEILPVKVENNIATFSVDTAKDGNTVYFEVSTK